MLIEQLRVIDNDKIETPEGNIPAPTAYFMDVVVNEKKKASVSISQDVYTVLHNLVIKSEPSTAPVAQA